MPFAYPVQILSVVARNNTVLKKVGAESSGLSSLMFPSLFSKPSVHTRRTLNIVFTFSSLIRESHQAERLPVSPILTPLSGSYGSWRWNGARQKRPMSSIVLEPGVKDMILNDCKDFLCSEEWYAERGELFCCLSTWRVLMIS